MIGEVEGYDVDSDTYIISYQRGPFDADISRSMLAIEEMKKHPRFPPGTEFLGVRREHIIVDYSEQLSPKQPVFLLLLSMIQVVVLFTSPSCVVAHCHIRSLRADHFCCCIRLRQPWLHWGRGSSLWPEVYVLPGAKGRW